MHAPGVPWAGLSLGLNACVKQCSKGGLLR